MWHHSKDIPVFVANTSNISRCTVMIGFRCNVSVLVAVFIDHLVICLQIIQQLFFCEIPSLTMSDRYHQRFIRTNAFQINIFTKELLVNISQKNAGQQVCFAKDLESIANSKHLSAFLSKGNNTLHHRTEFGNCTTTQVVSKGKSSRKY